MNRNATTRSMVMCGLTTAIICVCSIIKLPIPPSPVPVTLQTFAVAFAGIYIGKRWGTLSVIVYVLLGAVGLPVFAGMQSGIGYMAGPTGGFLIGFIASAYVMGLVYEILKKRSRMKNFVCIGVAMALGLIAIYCCGALWMMAAVPMTLGKAVLTTVAFIVPDGIKLTAAALVVAAMQRYGAYSRTV